LKEISSIGNGVYVNGKNTAEVTEEITSILSNLDKKEFEAKKFVSYKDRFQPILIVALLFLLMDLFLFETKTKWVEKLNLFNENDHAK